MSDADESEAERLNRQYDDLLQELRVSQNGTQILFAFLLTVPFSSGFKSVTSFERDAYFAALLLAGMSAAMLIAPAVMHRVLFNQGEKEWLVKASARITLAGQAILTLAVAASVFLIGDYLYGTAVGVVLALAMWVFWATWFFALPLRHRKGGQPVDTSSST